MMVRRTALTLIVAMGIWGCDVPTSAPSWDTRWILEVFDAEFGVEEFLPPEVSVSADRSVFIVDIPSASESTSLRSACSACAEFDGLVVQKPHFEVTLAGFAHLPDDVISVEVAGGTVVLEFLNGLGFDPIRPGGTATGSLALVIRDGGGDGRVVAEHRIEGDTDAIPPSSLTAWVIPLIPGSIEGALQPEVNLISPSGDPVHIDANQTIRMTMASWDLLISSTRVVLERQDVTLDPVHLNVSGVEEDLIDRIDAGGIDVQIDNPFSLDLDLDMWIEGPETPGVHREITIGPGTSTLRMDLTLAEIRSILGRPQVRVMGEGEARGRQGEVELRPDQQVFLSSRLDLDIRVGPAP